MICPCHMDSFPLFFFFFFFWFLSLPITILLTFNCTQIKEHLKHFQDKKPSDSEFIPSLQVLMDRFSQHADAEKRRTLPMLQSVMSDQENRNLAHQFERTKMFAPSRMHQEKPPFNNIVGLLSAPMDRLADLFRKWPDSASAEKDKGKEEKIYVPPQ